MSTDNPRPEHTGSPSVKTSGETVDLLAALQNSITAAKNADDDATRAERATLSEDEAWDAMWDDHEIICTCDGCNHYSPTYDRDRECNLATHVKAILAARERALREERSVLDEVTAERARQDAKWGEQNHPNGTGPTMTSLNRREFAQRECDYAAQRGTVTYRHILEEEVTEAFVESCPTTLRAELIQVAAVAVAWVEKIDRDALRGETR